MTEPPKWTTAIPDGVTYDLKTLQRTVNDMGLEWKKYHQIPWDNYYISAEKVVHANAHSVALLRGVGEKTFKKIDEFRTQLIHHLEATHR